MKKIILFLVGIMLFGTFVSATDYTFTPSEYANHPVDVAAGAFYGNLFTINKPFDGGLSALSIRPDTDETSFYWEIQKIITGATAGETWTGVFDGVNATGMGDVEFSAGTYYIGLRNNTGVTVAVDTRQSTYYLYNGGLALIITGNPYFPIESLTITGEPTRPQNVVNIFINNVLSKTYGQSSLYLSGRYIQSTLGDYTQLISSPYRGYTEL